jgi:hypothetical protein
MLGFYAPSLLTQVHHACWVSKCRLCTQVHHSCWGLSVLMADRASWRVQVYRDTGHSPPEVSFATATYAGNPLGLKQGVEFSAEVRRSWHASVLALLCMHQYRYQHACMHQY